MRRKRTNILTLAGLTVVAALLEPQSALAASSLTQVIGSLRTWLIGLLVTLATLLLTIGGVRYIFAAGDPGGIEKAKAAIKAALIGYALAALAPLLVSIAKHILGG